MLLVIDFAISLSSSSFFFSNDVKMVESSRMDARWCLCHGRRSH